MRVLTQPARIRSIGAMATSFPIYAPSRYAGTSEPVKRPKEFACFSYDENHEWCLGDKSLKWYYPPRLGVDLKKGYDKFIKHDNTTDPHLDGLLKTVMMHERTTNEAIDAHIVTWRGMMTKVPSPNPLFVWHTAHRLTLSSRSWLHLMITSRERAVSLLLSSF